MRSREGESYCSIVGDFFSLVHLILFIVPLLATSGAFPPQGGGQGDKRNGSTGRHL